MKTTEVETRIHRKFGSALLYWRYFVESGNRKVSTGVVDFERFGCHQHCEPFIRTARPCADSAADGDDSSDRSR